MNNGRSSSGYSRTFRQALNLAGLVASQYRSQDKLRRLQVDRLRRLAESAVRDVPFQRERFREAGIRPGDIRSLEDLRALPIMTREDLQKRPLADITAENLDIAACRTFATSGTSGVPLTIHYSPEDEAVFNLTWIRAYMTCGLRPRDRMAAFQGDRRQSPVSSPRWYGRLGFWRRTVVSTWEPAEAWIEALENFQPDAIVTDAATYRNMAETMQSLSRKAFRPRILFNVSVLIDPATRALLSETFGSAIFDLYGSFESGCLAWECPACRGYHINSDTAIVEIITDGREAGPGETGEVVVTNLFSSAMPVIRYSLGDIVVKSDHAPVCGRPFPLLARLDGRRDDILRLGDGRTIGPQPFHHIFSLARSVRGWRVVQTAHSRIAISIQPGPGFGPAQREALAADILDLFGPTISVEWNFPTEIPYDPAAKARAVVNLMKKSRG